MPKARPGGETPTSPPFESPIAPQTRPAPRPPGFPSPSPTDFPPPLGGGCIPTVSPARSPADFPSALAEGCIPTVPHSRPPGFPLALPNGFPAALGRRLHPNRAPSRKPLPRITHPNPKPRFYETNRNPSCANRAAREQPEGLRPSGSNTTSPTFQHPPSRRRRGRSAASHAPRVRAILEAAFPYPCPLALPNGFPAALGRRLHPNRALSRRPLPRITHPNPKPQFYETNRNPSCANRAAREQPEGLRPSGSNTTSQPSNTPHRAAGATGPPQATHPVSGRFLRQRFPTRAPSPSPTDFPLALAEGCIPPVPPPANPCAATPAKNQKSDFAKRTEPRTTAGAPQSSLRGKILQVCYDAPNAPAGHLRP
ncbi:MAG: hypothetical protein KatS3mg005_1439 [Bryobacteraceae bacterium]|nr:MAG: hypothetical protein KatS3mg005_1439 [Bryobacteraceae bacterium]